MFRIAGAILLATFIGPVSHALEAGDPVSTWTPDLELVGLIERRVVLPDDHHISEYVRFYAGIEEEGRRLVKAAYLYKHMSERDESGDSGITINYAGEGEIRIVEGDQIPFYFDGGCSIINTLYDISHAEFKYVQCNGLA